MDAAFDYRSVLAPGLRSRHLEAVNGLTMHVLEAGHDRPASPLVVLLHGFPELAYSYRKVMLPLAAAGFHAVAPDQRGFGRTTGWDADYDGDLGSFRALNLVRDVLGLVAALGARRVAAVVGHDFGAMVAAYCALIRPDVFGAVVLMSAPFPGPPEIAHAGSEAQRRSPAPLGSADALHAALAALPRPRKHYHRYFSTREANPDMWRCPQGVHDFLRAYFHHKSADWTRNRPYPLACWSAEELAKLPTYYMMNLNDTMPQTVAREMPDAATVEGCRWLSDEELAVYSTEFERTGFQGGLQWYRCRAAERYTRELEIFSGRTIDVPARFVAGRSDWGVYQSPGAFERMRDVACTQMRGCRLIDGAGHWVQQERPQEVVRAILGLLASMRRDAASTG